MAKKVRNLVKFECSTTTKKHLTLYRSTGIFKYKRQLLKIRHYIVYKRKQFVCLISVSLSNTLALVYL